MLSSAHSYGAWQGKLQEVVGAVGQHVRHPQCRTSGIRKHAFQAHLYLAFQVERPGELQEVVGAKRLSDNVSNILARLEGELDEVDTRIGESMHVLDLDNDGLVSLRDLGSHFCW